jgi:branched-chain amino acid transport system permease protein
MNATSFLVQLINGVTFAALLFLVSSGFTLIFGLMRIANLAHGSFYLIGGYIGYSVSMRTGNFLLAIIVAALAVGILGLLIERVILRLVRNQALPEVLITVGIGFILADLSLIIWGGNALSVPMPLFLQGSVLLGSITYPRFRLFVLVLGILIAILLWLFTEYTRVGAIVRAGVDDAEMVEGLGINIKVVFTGVFLLGAALAGIGGVMGGAFLSLYPGADSEILLYGLVVVIIGGLGSLPGAIVGSLLIGIIDTFGRSYFPDLSYFTIFGPMVVMLALRPQGLFGRA